MSDAAWQSEPPAQAQDDFRQPAEGDAAPAPAGRDRDTEMYSPPRTYDRDRSRSPSRRDRSRGGDAPPEQPEDANQGNNLYVTGLDPVVDEDRLRLFFNNDDPNNNFVEKCDIMRDPHTRESRGFAFVNFYDAAEADTAIENKNGVKLESRVVTVQRARRGRARPKTPGQYYGPPKETRPPRDSYDRGGYGYEPRSRYDDYRDSYSSGARDYGRPPRDSRDAYPRRDAYNDRPPPREDYGRPYERDSRGPPAGGRGDRYGGPPPDRYGGPPDRGGYADRGPSDRYSSGGPPPRDDGYSAPRRYEGGGYEGGGAPSSRYGSAPVRDDYRDAPRY